MKLNENKSITVANATQCQHPTNIACYVWTVINKVMCGSQSDCRGGLISKSMPPCRKSELHIATSLAHKCTVIADISSSLFHQCVTTFHYAMSADSYGNMQNSVMRMSQITPNYKSHFSRAQHHRVFWVMYQDIFLKHVLYEVNRWTQCYQVCSHVNLLY